MSDALGDRMKAYETVESGRRFMPLLPVVARLDGKNFSNYTRGLARPYDVKLSELMVELTRELVQRTSASVGYTQSDEISLAWYSANSKSRIYFDARVQKMTSVLAAMCSVHFNMLLNTYLPNKSQGPVFDCRTWQVPTLEEAANVFLWREWDATKNSISMAAGEYYSHKELMHKSSPEKQEMLWAKGINWNDYPDFFKRGSYVQKRVVKKPLCAEELAMLPPKHHAHKNPNLNIERTEYVLLKMPPLASVKNRVDVLFRGQEPVVEKENTNAG